MNSAAVWTKTSPRDPLFQESRAYAARRDWPPLPFAPVQLAPDARILIVKLSAIGDCVLASPLAAALRARYPGAHIAWAVGAKAQSVVQNHPALNQVLVQQPGARGALKMLQSVRGARFDAVLDVQGALKSAPLVLASGARWRAVSSRAEPIARRAANLIVPIEGTPPHALEQYLRVASAFDIDPQASRRATLGLEAAEIAWADEFLREKKSDFSRESNGAPPRLVALNPASLRPIKAWPAAHFAILADELEARGIKTVFVGGPNDREVVAQIIAAMTHSPLDAAGKTNLRQLAALLSRCDLLVSADTGPMHIAAGVGTPVVALFGPTDPRRTGPGGENHLVLTRDLGCRPCFQKPTCERFECLSEMAPPDVLAATLRHLDATARDAI